MQLGNKTILVEFARIVKLAESFERWLIVVCPPKSRTYQTLRSAGLGIYPHGTKIMGRTSLLTNGSRVSVFESNAMPPGSGFDLVFMGWGEGIIQDQQSLERWRKAARDVLSVNETIA